MLDFLFRYCRDSKRGGFGLFAKVSEGSIRAIKAPNGLRACAASGMG